MPRLAYAICHYFLPLMPLLSLRHIIIARHTTILRRVCCYYYHTHYYARLLRHYYATLLYATPTLIYAALDSWCHYTHTPGHTPIASLLIVATFIRSPLRDITGWLLPLAMPPAMPLFLRHLLFSLRQLQHADYAMLPLKVIYADSRHTITSFSLLIIFTALRFDTSIISPGCWYYFITA